jgi:nitroreductase
MEKPAETKHHVHELIRRRWSPVAFERRPVEKEKLCSLFEAARWAPSCFNEQPWAYLVTTIEDEKEHARLLSCLVPANQSWAKAAPVLMISVAKLHFDKNGKENRHALHDVGLASENLVIQAMSLGLLVHQMAGFDLDKARELYKIPATHVPVAAIALGYPSDGEGVPQELQEREKALRSRKAIESFVFTGQWTRTFAAES